MHSPTSQPPPPARSHAARYRNWLVAIVWGLLVGGWAQGLQAQVIPTDSMPGGQDPTWEPPADTSAVIIIGGVPEPAEAVDSNAVARDSTHTRKHEKGSHALKLHLSPKKDIYEPKIAVRRSAVLPGWGQIYNNRIWKVPIIYGGFAVFLSFIIQNQVNYKQFDNAVKCTGTPGSCVPNPYYQMGLFYSIDGLIAQREGYRRNRDFNVILCGLWYLLNVVDAYVDSHLRNFTVSDDLSLNIDPSIMSDPFRKKNIVVGASLTFNLRK